MRRSRPNPEGTLAGTASSPRTTPRPSPACGSYLRLRSPSPAVSRNVLVRLRTRLAPQLRPFLQLLPGPGLVGL
ncbi:hypothetical protein Y1Q_0015875 [Alligator mississippiensis]|uniref:Uncharacterized protein n=1 Tax=Alligator mississippiensis TaxID=8496 RepID=A0A151MHC2_ALLMI|nr:hypothetical protein Y1Q_0015875 [Alligator mississippiensis]